MFGGSQNKRSRNRSKKYRSKRNRSKFTKKFGKSMRGGGMERNDEYEYRRLCKDYITKYLLFLIITRIKDDKGDDESQSHFDQIYRLLDEAFNRQTNSYEELKRKYPKEENKLSLIAKEAEIYVYNDIFIQMIDNNTDVQQILFDYLYKSIQQKPSPRKTRNLNLSNSRY